MELAFQESFKSACNCVQNKTQIRKMTINVRKKSYWSSCCYAIWNKKNQKKKNMMKCHLIKLRSSNCNLEEQKTYGISNNWNRQIQLN